MKRVQLENKKTGGKQKCFDSPALLKYWASRGYTPVPEKTKE